MVRAISSATDAQLHAELWYSADADGGATQLLGAADGTPPPNVGAHLVPWIDAMFCSGALAADGALRVQLRATSGSSNIQVIESELTIP